VKALGDTTVELHVVVVVKGVPPLRVKDTLILALIKGMGAHAMLERGQQEEVSLALLLGDDEPMTLQLPDHPRAKAIRIAIDVVGLHEDFAGRRSRLGLGEERGSREQQEGE
jgi:hypothetical protein